MEAYLKKRDKELGECLARGEFNYTFSLKGICYYLFGAFSLPFAIYLAFGWLIESAITGDVLLYQILGGDHRFGYPGIGVLFILPISSFIGITYCRLTLNYIGFFFLHTIAFFRILNRKIDLKYHYTPSSFVNVVLWIHIVVGIIYLIIFITLFLQTHLTVLSFGIPVSLAYIFIVYMLKRTGIKWLWGIILIPSLPFFLGFFSSIMNTVGIDYFSNSLINLIETLKI